ncbi:hypothetical protein DGMP_06160 [Desulfomarina profundi]|uniref:Uncharacterized protein n=2 Tax=Desulfomarina profundi TaxID=2772557 RepID=A0A8D5FEP4_9BACT|nr:hypothetical protein DGMP_06160 [Desulfomarina profundi]
MKLIMDKKINIWRERIVSFTIGALCLFVVSLLMGAASDYQNSTLNYGRYQISSWATQLNRGSGAVGAFVLDTVSGETRTVYMRTYGDPGDTRVVKNNLKKSFSAMR